MKLLSMKSEGGARAGIVIGEDVLDVTGFCKILEEKGEQASSPHPPLEGVYHDALDLYLYGMERLKPLVSQLENDPQLAGELKASGALRPLASVELNPPVIAPGKILAVGLNYAAHAAEQNIQPPASPLIFSKCTTALTGPGDPIILPRISDRVDYEAELAVVIGREAKSVSRERAFDYVAGYTIMNDVTARDLQRNERQWTRAKGLDTFAPCGPWLVTVDELEDRHSLSVQLWVNGELRQSSDTDDLIFKIPEVIEFISQDLTLRPGDIITTGTPSGVGVFLEPPVFLKAGDRIEIEIGQIGRLANTVVAQGE
ncbi:MAG: fumarylacetoacetate hydrolase family protein [Blastocatellia bacterium]|nr:fumarylacetoacetate hydrolase family protein [Blastocatellia bacterium]